VAGSLRGRYQMDFSTTMNFTFRRHELNNSQCVMPKLALWGGLPWSLS
jgi:hypothetical protein